MHMRWLALPVLMAIGSAAMAADCPPLLEGQLPKLRPRNPSTCASALPASRW